ncbi:peptidyl-prolyl isomerase [Isoalcanivorax pacificus W11-5]|uniref:Peptidyl-prolyl cis-trans isomerase n=1 Tax=Isoalcanivorax pacificus W11-5 TaxID=391936 RepID=A0A0B4XK58_9GAMM|nr:FKBP-type peptidyl-prolyl cis-trans isomerase [Isoalcanivorax pacificus]AJD47065.1 peptidyl-prolyl isomerase [Isoalcanivorax pacificus W11-5]
MSDDILRVGPQMRITMHFAVRLMDGTEIDSTFERDPATFSWGDESLLPGFERALLGLKAGDRRSMVIEASQGFGDYNEDNVQHFRAEEFGDEADLRPGVVMQFADASQAELPGVIQTVDDEWVTVDFNHPLAGRDLTFEVEILDVQRDAPEQPVILRH